MPFETRLFVKTAVVWLVLGFLAGAALLIAKALGQAAPYALSTQHAHMEFVGWLVNMVAGFALWMLPLDRERFPETKGRYPAKPILTAYYLLNLGLLVRILDEPWFDLAGKNSLNAMLLVLAALAQVAAVGVFAWIVWTRIRAAGIKA